MYASRLLLLSLSAATNVERARRVCLKADVETRWGSVFDMIERIIKPIQFVLGGDQASAHLVSTWQDLDVLN